MTSPKSKTHKNSKADQKVKADEIFNTHETHKVAYISVFVRCPLDNRDIAKFFYCNPEHVIQLYQEKLPCSCNYCLLLILANFRTT
jgi:hypothetical protein